MRIRLHPSGNLTNDSCTGQGARRRAIEAHPDKTMHPLGRLICRRISSFAFIDMGLESAKHEVRIRVCECARGNSMLLPSLDSTVPFPNTRVVDRFPCGMRRKQDFDSFFEYTDFAERHQRIEVIWQSMG